MQGSGFLGNFPLLESAIMLWAGGRRDFWGNGKAMETTLGFLFLSYLFLVG